MSDRKHVSSAKTVESRAIDVCFVFETRIWDPSMVIRLTSRYHHKEPSRLTLQLSGDLSATSHGIVGASISLRSKTEKALSKCIPLDNRLCAVRLNKTMKLGHIETPTASFFSSLLVRTLVVTRM